MATIRDRNDWDAYQHKLKAEHEDREHGIVGDNKWTAPFAPWCGEKWWDAPESDRAKRWPRILFVGKCLGISKVDVGHSYWQKPIQEWRKAQRRKAQLPTSPQQATKTYMEERLQKFNPGTHPFWTVCLLIASGVLQPDLADGDEGKIFDYIAWSNYYKINYYSGAKDSYSYNLPQPRQCRHQNNKSCIHCMSPQWLLEEITILKPDVIVLSLGGIWEREHGAAVSLGLNDGSFRPLMTLPANNIVERVYKNITDEFGRLPEIIEVAEADRPKSVWVTQHFSRPILHCIQGTLPLQIKRALAGQ